MVENANRELDNEEKTYCSKVIIRVITGILIFAVCCTLVNYKEIVSLIALTILIVFISRCIEILRKKR